MGARSAIFLATAAIAGCAPAGPSEISPLGEATASFLSDDLIRVTVDVTGRTEDAAAVRTLTDCAAAEAMLLRGSAFARHVRTNIDEEGGISHVDAVYTVSATEPAGDFVIDAEAVAAECREQGTVRV